MEWEAYITIHYVRYVHGIRQTKLTGREIHKSAPHNTRQWQYIPHGKLGNYLPSKNKKATEVPHKQYFASGGLSIHPYAIARFQDLTTLELQANPGTVHTNNYCGSNQAVLHNITYQAPAATPNPKLQIQIRSTKIQQQWLASQQIGDSPIFWDIPPNRSEKSSRRAKCIGRNQGKRPCITKRDGLQPRSACYRELISRNEICWEADRSITWRRRGDRNSRGGRRDETRWERFDGEKLILRSGRGPDVCEAYLLQNCLLVLCCGPGQKVAAYFTFEI
jgi:hypothetical protein